MTFYDETFKAITDSAHWPTDVTFVGQNDGELGMDWVQFTNESQFIYDSGYGTAEIPANLIIQFNDGSWLERREYDGSEWWEYVPLMPKYVVAHSAACSLKKDPESHFGEYELVRV